MEVLVLELFCKVRVRTEDYRNIAIKKWIRGKKSSPRVSENSQHNKGESHRIMLTIEKDKQSLEEWSAKYFPCHLQGLETS